MDTQDGTYRVIVSTDVLPEQLTLSDPNRGFSDGQKPQHARRRRGRGGGEGARVAPASRIARTRAYRDGRRLTDTRRFAPTSVHLRRNPRSPSAESVFNFSGIRTCGGNPFLTGCGSTTPWSIPAHAGETWALSRTSCGSTVHPRACGGNSELTLADGDARPADHRPAIRWARTGAAGAGPVC